MRCEGWVGWPRLAAIGPTRAISVNPSTTKAASHETHKTLLLWLIHCFWLLHVCIWLYSVCKRARRTYPNGPVSADWLARIEKQARPLRDVTMARPAPSLRSPVVLTWRKWHTRLLAVCMNDHVHQVDTRHMVPHSVARIAIVTALSKNYVAMAH